MKRSITIAGHRTSVSIEDPFWSGLGEMATARGASVAELIAAIDQERGSANLSSAIRMAVLAWYRGRVPAAD
ncbi:MAG: ribbon-helix-helix domain-containing protein [Bauldia sp.]|nr:ribbon-helix-helix domain-containing protein [Bauldia sp.]